MYSYVEDAAICRHRVDSPVHAGEGGHSLEDRNGAGLPERCSLQLMHLSGFAMRIGLMLSVDLIIPGYAVIGRCADYVLGTCHDFTGAASRRSI